MVKGLLKELQEEVDQEIEEAHQELSTFEQAQLEEKRVSEFRDTLHRVIPLQFFQDYKPGAESEKLDMIIDHVIDRGARTKEQADEIMRVILHNARQQHKEGFRNDLDKVVLTIGAKIRR